MTASHIELAGLTKHYLLGDERVVALDDVAAEVAAAEQAGELTPDARVIEAEDADDIGEEGEAFASAPSAVTVAEQRTLSAEEAIAKLREKIDRMGPVNMMAIGQFDELEQRHTFLTTQRKDLLDSIAQTGEAIKRIDKTTKERFEEAFHSINEKFQVMFSTVFGGGRATLLLIDQENETESGIDIQAQQIADGVVILGAVQSPHGGGASGHGLGGGPPIQRRLEVVDHRLVVLFIGTRHAGRRHVASA